MSYRFFWVNKKRTHKIWNAFCSSSARMIDLLRCGSLSSSDSEWSIICFEWTAFKFTVVKAERSADAVPVTFDTFKQL